jgi:hypothetical protein
LICHGKFFGRICAAFKVTLILFGIGFPKTGFAQLPSSTNTTAGEQTSVPLPLPDALGLAPAHTAEIPVSLTSRQKIVSATRNAFGPLSLVFAAAGAGVNQCQDLYPAFHQGATGYSRYLWHSYSDQAVDSYFTGYILPSLLHQDPRYYPLGKGGFSKRTGYAFSRLFITRSDSGVREFNLSQVLGSGMAASASSLYYPERDLTASLVTERWASNLAGDGLLLALREFTPEIAKIFHLRREPQAEKNAQQ